VLKTVQPWILPFSFCSQPDDSYIFDFYDKEIVVYGLNMLYFYIWRQHWAKIISQTQRRMYRLWPVMERKCDTIRTTRKRRKSHLYKGGEGEQNTTLCLADWTAVCHVRHAASLGLTKFIYIKYKTNTMMC
jgi:hypothetical protein